MDNLLSTNFPQSKTISPAVMAKPAVENVPSSNYLNRRLNFAKAPPHYRSRNLDYATTLPPSPRNNITNNPACVTCNKYPNQPFKRGKCYMLYSPQQNIWGPVCGDGGYNANWVRGNRFGVDYQYDKVFHRQDYGVDVPRFIKKNPVIVSNSPYFPFDDYNLRFNPKYKSYPYVKNFIKGMPTYTYPYATLSQPTKTNVCPSNIVEGFSNRRENKLIIFGILILIMFIFFYYMRR